MFTESRNLWIVRLAERQCDEIHKFVDLWHYFDQKTIGQQLQRAADSVGANIIEGCGRHHQKDALNFLYMARASLDETTFWIRRASERHLISTADMHAFLVAYTRLSKGLSAFIKHRRHGIH